MHYSRDKGSICYLTFSAMADDVEALCLVRECRELEERYKSDFTSAILSAQESGDGLEIIRNAQKIIKKKDRLLLLCKASKYQFVQQIADNVGWKKLWDNALDHGPSVSKGMKNLVRVITYPDHSPRKCPICDIANLDKPTLAEHVISNHTKSNTCWNSLLDSLSTMEPNSFGHVLCLLHIF